MPEQRSTQTRCAQAKQAPSIRFYGEYCEKTNAIPAKEQFFAIPEVLEIVLLQLKIQDLLLRVPLVCKHFKKMVDKTPSLQQALFFQPVPGKTLQLYKSSPKSYGVFWADVQAKPSRVSNDREENLRSDNHENSAGPPASHRMSKSYETAVEVDIIQDKEAPSRKVFINPFLSSLEVIRVLAAENSRPFAWPEASWRRMRICQSQLELVYERLWDPPKGHKVSYFSSARSSGLPVNHKRRWFKTDVNALVGLLASCDESCVQFREIYASELWKKPEFAYEVLQVGEVVDRGVCAEMVDLQS